MRRIAVILAALLLSCSPGADRADIDRPTLPPKNLQMSGGKTIFIAVQTQAEITQLCGRKTYGCVIGRAGEKDSVMYMINPCLYASNYAEAMCHEWGHVMQFELGLTPGHEGYSK